jgi:hypothetical protein
MSENVKQAMPHDSKLSGVSLNAIAALNGAVHLQQESQESGPGEDDLPQPKTEEDHDDDDDEDDQLTEELERLTDLCLDPTYSPRDENNGEDYPWVINPLYSVMHGLIPKKTPRPKQPNPNEEESKASHQLHEQTKKRICPAQAETESAKRKCVSGSVQQPSSSSSSASSSSSEVRDRQLMPPPSFIPLKRRRLNSQSTQS